MFYVYLIQSQLDNSFYVGYTKDLENRLKQHNNGDSTYTKRKIPWKLVYSESFKNKSDALKREIFLKKQRNINFYQGLVDNSDR